MGGADDFGYELTNEDTNNSIWRAIQDVMEDCEKEDNVTLENKEYQLFVWNGSWNFRKQFMEITKQFPEVKFIFGAIMFDDDYEGVRIYQCGEVVATYNHTKIVNTERIPLDTWINRNQFANDDILAIMTRKLKNRFYIENDIDIKKESN